MSRRIRAMLAVAALLALAAVAAGCSSPGPGLVSGADAESLVADGIRVIDVRTAAEFAGAHLPAAENVPMNALQVAAGGWDPAEPILVYCATGQRSASAAEYLRSIGFQNVYDLDGGIVAWRGELAGGAGGSAAGASASGGVALPQGVPVLLEFYTDT